MVLERIPAMLAALACLRAVAAATHMASGADDVAAACRIAVPGDVVVLATGTYTDQRFVFSGTGTPEQPITLRAETPGKVILNGSSRLSIGGEHLVVENLLFRGGALDSGSVVEFRIPAGGAARHCALRHTAIIDCNPPEMNTRYAWISVYGTDNTVERCWLSGQAHSGVTLCVWLDAGQPARHTIRRNYFGNRRRGNANGFETIRIGTSARSMTNARCLVAENLFERCDGEIETISNKSCENTYSRNTFLQCSGCLTLRHGNRCIVEDNVFVGGDAKGAGGVRVVGEGHRIAGNWFAGTKGRAGGAVSLQAGMANSPLSGYFQVKDCRIERNVFTGNPGPLFALDAGYDGTRCALLPENVLIANNLMLGAAGAKPMIVATNPVPGVVWQDNVACGGPLGMDPPAGIRVVEAIPEQQGTGSAAEPLGPRDVGPAWMRAPTTP